MCNKISQCATRLYLCGCTPQPACLCKSFDLLFRTSKSYDEVAQRTFCEGESNGIYAPVEAHKQTFDPWVIYSPYFLWLFIHRPKQFQNKQFKPINTSVVVFFSFGVDCRQKKVCAVNFQWKGIPNNPPPSLSLFGEQPSQLQSLVLQNLDHHSLCCWAQLRY